MAVTVNVRDRYTLDLKATITCADDEDAQEMRDSIEDEDPDVVTYIAGSITEQMDVDE